MRLWRCLSLKLATSPLWHAASPRQATEDARKTQDSASAQSGPLVGPIAWEQSCGIWAPLTRTVGRVTTCTPPTPPPGSSTGSLSLHVSSLSQAGNAYHPRGQGCDPKAGPGDRPWAGIWRLIRQAPPQGPHQEQSEEPCSAGWAFGLDPGGGEGPCAPFASPLAVVLLGLLMTQD